MAKFFKLEVVAPDKEVFNEEVSSITVPGAAGEFGVLARHEPMVSILKPGTFIVSQGSKRNFYFVSGGFIEVTPDSATVLAEEFEEASEIDAEQEEKARKRAMEKITKSKDAVEKEASRAILARTQARLSTLKKAKA